MCLFYYLTYILGVDFDCAMCNDRFQKMKAQTDDTAGQPTELENTNKNAKRKRCSCQLIEAELINIGKLTRKALAIIHSNEYVCTRCGGTAQRASQ